MSNESANKRIAKNTLFLYMRMVLIMVVSLYTTRVVLNTLGVEDYGIYNIVSGITVLFAFLSFSMTSASIRFLSYALGKDDKDQQINVFNVLINSFAIISALGLIGLETIGLWFVDNQLNIPIDRTDAVTWLYQCSIIIFLSNIIRIPFHSMVIAHERMSFYAYLSIVEAVLKLVIVYLLQISPGDKLIVYSILMVVVSIITLVFYLWYCVAKFDTCKLRTVVDLKLYKQLLSFMGWSAINGGSVLVSQQMSSIIANIYCGVIANAAMGIANTVGSAIYSFISNFQTAFNPRLIKLYALEEKSELEKLVVRASIFSLYLLLLLAVPIVMEMEYILGLWLSEVPTYTIELCKLILVYNMIDAIQAPLWMYINASGNIRAYTIVNSTLFLLTIPVSYLLLQAGYSVYWVLIVKVLCNVLGSIYRLLLLKTKYKFKVGVYLNNALVPSMVVVAFSFVCSYLVKDFITYNYPLLTMVISMLLVLVFAMTLGLRHSERIIIMEFVKSKIVSLKY